MAHIKQFTNQLAVKKHLSELIAIERSLTNDTKNRGATKRTLPLLGKADRVVVGIMRPFFCLNTRTFTRRIGLPRALMFYKGSHAGLKVA